jgi:DNA modification methylase
MKNKQFLNQVICGDSLKKVLPEIEDNSIDVVITDPPYFLDKMDDSWSCEKVSNSDNHHVIKSLPAGMKFDREQGRKFILGI